MKNCRVAAVLLVGLVFLVLLGVTLSDISQHFPLFFSFPSNVMQFGFSVLVAFLFASIGSLVWMFTYKRNIAPLFLGFCSAIMIDFEVEPAALLQTEKFFTILTNASSTIAILLFSVILVFFPKNYFLETPIFLEIIPFSPSSVPKHVLLKWYLLIIILLGAVLVLCAPLASASLQTSTVLHTIENYYYSSCLVCSFFFLLSSRHSVQTRRERQQEQQWRLLVVGIVAAIAPFFTLTLFPTLLRLPDRLQVGGHISTISLIFLPLSLGYGLLRYQLLFPDGYVRRITGVLLGVLALIIVSGGILFGDLLLFPFQKGSGFLITLCLLLPIAGSLAWYGSRHVAQWSFLPEFPSQRIFNPMVYAQTQKNVIRKEEIARLLGTALGTLFETFEVCVFALVPESGIYRLIPQVERSNEFSKEERFPLLQTLRECKIIGSSRDQDIERIHSLISYLSVQKSHVFLHEFLATSGIPSPVLPRSFLLSEFESQSPLLVPLFRHDLLIAIIAVRTSDQELHFTGPDFWDLPWFTDFYGELLYSAIVQEQKNFEQKLHEIVHHFTQSDVLTNESVVHTAVQLCDRAELWRYDTAAQQLVLDVFEGTGPSLASVLSSDYAIRERLPHPYFYEAGRTKRGKKQASPFSYETSEDVFSPLSFACLPLQGFGLLVLTYTTPHIFSEIEKGVLQIFSVSYVAHLMYEESKALLSSVESQEQMPLFQRRYWECVRREFQDPLNALHDHLLLVKSGRLPPERAKHILRNVQKTLYLLFLLEGSCKELMMVSPASSFSRTSVPIASALVFTASLFEDIFRYEHRTFVSSLSSDLSIQGTEESLRQLFVHVLRLICSMSPMETVLTVSSTETEDTVSVYFIVSSSNAIRQLSAQQTSLEGKENRTLLLSHVTFFTHLLQGTFSLHEYLSELQPFSLVFTLKKGHSLHSAQSALFSSDSNITLKG